MLLGGPGNNYLAGTIGNDRYVVFGADPGITIVDEVVEEIRFLNGRSTFADGRDSTDTLEFPDVAFGEIAFGAGTFDASAVEGSGVYRTLDMTWGSAGGVRVLLPHADNPFLELFPGRSFGIESIRFADGTVLRTANLFVGTAGQDFLSGGAGDDFFVGGRGDDFLAGGEGSDTYYFGLGDGRDLVSDVDLSGSDSVDTLRFGPGILPEDVTVTRVFDLHLRITGTGDEVVLSSWAGQGREFRIERIEFANGVVWGVEELDARAVTNPPTEGNDELSGTGRDDVIDGLDGDDQIVGDAGDDILIGGAGDDYLAGNDGNDILRGGPGSDRLEEWGVGHNLMDGGEGDDYLYEEGGTLVMGGPGDDWIDHFGPGGVVSFNAGDGADAIYVAGSLTLSLGGGINPASMSLSGDGGDLVLALGGGDSIRLVHAFRADPAAWPELNVQLFGEFAVEVYDLRAVVQEFHARLALDPAPGTLPLDGVLQSHRTGASVDRAIGGDIAYRYARDGNLDALPDAAIREILAYPEFGRVAQAVSSPVGPPVIATEANEVLVGSHASESLVGGAGEDWLDAGAGNDTLAGGPGNDLLFGGPGADTYVFHPGDGVDTIYDPSGPGESNTVVFGPGITPDSLTLGLGSLWVRVGDGGDAIRLLSFDPRNPLGPRDVDRFRFADGSELSYEALIARGFDIFGTPAGETLHGTAVSDRIHGLAGDDVLNGGPGDDLLDGGPGDDVLRGGPGNDTYRYGAGSGTDWIEDEAGEFDTLLLGEGISPESVAVSRHANYIHLQVPDGLLRIRQEAADGYYLERVRFADGTAWDAATLESKATATNTAPTLSTPLADQFGNQNAPFRFVVPAGTFTDSDAGDVLTLSAALADGSALPAWLGFDPATDTFHGLPGELDVGELDIRVTATDTGGASVSGTFILSVSDASVRDETHFGTAGKDSIVTGFANDLVFAGRGDDTVQAGAGRDVVFGGAGHDRISGEAGNDRLYGGEGQDWLDGGAGDDLLAGGGGHDRILADSGSNLVIGGEGHDIITGGSGRDVFMMNLGDGHDVLHLSGAAAGNGDVISLGGGIAAGNLFLRRRDADLVVEARGPKGGDTRVTLTGWYSSLDHQTVVALQFVKDGAADLYDFRALVSRFDDATGGAPNAGPWRAATALPEVLLASGVDPEGGVVATTYADSGRVYGDPDAENASSPSRPVGGTPAIEPPVRFGSDDSGRVAAVPGGKAKPERADARKTSASLLEEYFDRRPLHDFEILAREIERSGRSEKPLDQVEIARRWRIVSEYAGFSINEDAQGGGAADWNNPIGKSLVVPGVPGLDTGGAPAIGLRGGADLRPLKGLEEGFHSLKW